MLFAGGALGASMSGTGPSVFGLFGEEQEALHEGGGSRGGAPGLSDRKGAAI